MDKIDSDTAETCTRQFREFEAAKQKEIDDRQKGKEADEQLQAEMKDYQRGKGAVPPGAKGNKGGGRLQHSTNTRLGQPASFSFSRAVNHANKAGTVTHGKKTAAVTNSAVKTPVSTKNTTNATAAPSPAPS